MKKLILLMSLVSIITSCGKSHQGGDAVIEVKKAALVAETTKLWENGKVLNVVFLDGTPELQLAVATYADEWTQYANLTFNYYSSTKALPKGEKAHISVTFKAKGNNSSVGTDSAHKFFGHSMSLSALSKDNYTNRYYIIHEFGHAIGLHHEHQNINRSFELDEKKALEYCKKAYSMNENDCRLNVISFKKGKGYYSSKYDPKSIMHYSVHKDITTNQVEVSVAYNLSLLDKLEVSKLYPGRKSAEEIITQHRENLSMADDYRIFNNCRLTETTVESIRLNAEMMPEKMKVPYYGFESLVPSDYKKSNIFEDKEVAVREMVENQYCNLKADELKSFRVATAISRAQSKSFGNCEIPLDENGLPISKNCFDSAPFRILKIGKDEMAIQSCYQSFENARDALKTVPYCSLSKEEIEKQESAEAEKLKEDLKYGKCFVTDKKEMLGNARKCPAITPWFVTDGSMKNLLGFCAEKTSGLIRDMKAAKECQL